MEEHLFVEKYRPKTVSECILPNNLRAIFDDIVTKGVLGNYIFSGTAGVGKTTIAKALAHDLDYDVLYVNASKDNGIDILRTQIADFAPKVSFNGNPKLVILDEADYLNPNSVQPALRGFIEEFSKNCRFIFTCNYPARIIEPLHSRCPTIDFSISKEDKPKIAQQFYKRTLEIMKAENIEYDKDVIIELVSKHFPDFRRILGEIQKYSVNGKIDSGILSSTSDSTYIELIGYLKDKKFSEVRKWVALNSGIPFVDIANKLYSMSTDKMVPVSIPQLVIILADYDYKSAFVSDHEINTTACLTEIMSTCNWK